MKYDNGKPDISLIPPEAIVQVAEVLGFGAAKYGAWNWRHDGDSTEWSRTYSSIQRHLTSFWAGEDIDPESGKSHLAHATTQLMIFMTQIADGNTSMDDRFKPTTKATILTE